MGDIREFIEENCPVYEIREACPYLPGRESLLRSIDGRPLGALYRQLLDEGYRRSGPVLYRPACEGCQECRVLRVPVAKFRRTKSQRRVWNRGGRIFGIRIGEPSTTPEKVALYERYLREHHGSAERQVSPVDYEFFFVSSSLGSATKELQLLDGDRLVGVGILDVFEDALSSVYFYFDPDYKPMSPGTYSALVEIDLARRWGLDYYYLGYYIAGCDSMNYKARFAPAQVRTPGEGTWEAVFPT